MTVIFVKNPSSLTELNTEQLTFKPIVVQCSTIDADVMLAKLKQDINDGKPINELEIVYLPLFNSTKFSPTELFNESTGLIKNLQINDNSKRKLFALSVALVGKIVDESAIRKLLEEVNMEGNVIIKVAEEIGEERGRLDEKETIAKKMLISGCRLSDIINFTGLDLDRLEDLRNSLHAEVV